MTHPTIASFADAPLHTVKRRLADLPGRVVDGDPQHETHMYFESADGAFLAGTWTSTPGKWRMFSDREEFCTIVSGRFELIDPAGNAREFGAGDSFVIPNGFNGYWNILETTTKHFVIRNYDPA